MKSNSYEDYYKIGKSLGKGGFAEVFEAIHIATNEKRALKIIDKKIIKKLVRKSIFKEPTEVDMKPYIDGFHNEVKNMQIMEGDDKENINTVKFYEFFNTEDKFVIVMELCQNNLFDFFMKEESALNAEKIYDILSQLNYSFRMMVAKKLIHRDLKLENILVKYENDGKKECIFKLTDYGVSRILLSLTNVLRTQVGTLRYMAPEVLETNPEYNQEIDLWSLGIIIYILIKRKYPFEGDNEKRFLISIRNTVLKKVSDNVYLDDLIQKLLNKDKKKRLDWKNYFNHPFFVKRNYNDYYDRIDKLGQGGFSTVFSIRHKKTKQERAIKIIDKEEIKKAYESNYFSKPSEEDLKKYFDGLSEIERMMIIEGDNKENKNTVKFYEYFDTDLEFCIVMELCDTNLGDYLAKKDKSFNVREIYNILKQLNNSFKVMTSKKIVHRDLKLDNILLKFDKINIENYTLKLTDYGLSKEIVSLTKKLSTKKIGTCNYMAPEVLEGNTYDDKCDLWSLGVIIFILFFKRFPYSGSNTSAVKNNIDSLGIFAITKTGNDILDDLINRLLTIDPEKRISWNDYFEHQFFKKGINEIREANKKNQITINFIVDNTDQKENNFKKIYFLQNDYYLSNNIEEKFDEENDEIKKLNKANTQLYINNKKQAEFQKYFVPNAEGPYEIKIIFKNKMKDCSYMFRNCQNIKNIDLSFFDSSNVTSMKYMFGKCINLEKINLKKLNTENVKDMSYMFNKCKNLKIIDFPSSFSTQNVINMNGMFHNCDNLSKINFNSSFNTQKVTSMKMMFGKCYSLKKLNLKYFNIENVGDMSFMFDGCYNLEEILLNTSLFKTKNVASMGHMFFECYKLKFINLSCFTGEKINLVSNMFNDCTEMKNINLSKFCINEEVDTNFMFKGCNNLETLDLSSFKFINGEKIKNMFYGLSNIKKIKVSQNSIENCKKYFKDIGDKFSFN